MSENQFDKYFWKVEEMSIPQLEKAIHKLYPTFLKSDRTAKWKMYACLWKIFKSGKNLKMITIKK